MKFECYGCSKILDASKGTLINWEDGLRVYCGACMKADKEKEGQEKEEVVDDDRGFFSFGK